VCNDDFYGVVYVDKKLGEEIIWLIFVRFVCII
jgi:hypothetical protein